MAYNEVGSSRTTPFAGVSPSTFAFPSVEDQTSLCTASPTCSSSSLLSPRDLPVLVSDSKPTRQRIRPARLSVKLGDRDTRERVATVHLVLQEEAVAEDYTPFAENTRPVSRLTGWSTPAYLRTTRGENGPWPTSSGTWDPKSREKVVGFIEETLLFHDVPLEICFEDIRSLLLVFLGKQRRKTRLTAQQHHNPLRPTPTKATDWPSQRHRKGSPSARPRRPTVYQSAARSSASSSSSSGRFCLARHARRRCCNRVGSVGDRVERVEGRRIAAAASTSRPSHTAYGDLDLTTSSPERDISPRGTALAFH